MFYQIIKNLITILSIHTITDILFTTTQTNNITCALSQFYFLLNALLITVLDTVVGEDKLLLVTKTTNNLLFLYGYFCYDILYIVLRSPTYVFFFHHIISMGFIHLLVYVGIPIDLVLHYNIFCIVIEGSSPFINFRHVLKGTQYEQINKYIIVTTYTVFRIILYPIVYFYTLKKLEQKYLMTTTVKNLFYYKFYLIYSMSVIWYRKVLKYLK